MTDMIVALLCSATSRVMLNGVLGDPIRHGRRLHQGDPLSPLLFVLAIDPIQNPLDVATRSRLLHSFGG